MKLFDLHCDTPYELYTTAESLADNSLHISMRRANMLKSYIQVAAVWSQRELSAEAAWEQFLRIAHHFKAEVERTENAVLCPDADSIEAAIAGRKRAFILSVEDARILNGDIARIDILRQYGVRILTLLWGGESCLGGSHDTDAPLTPFGREVVRRCFECGIVPDVSHASRAVTADVLALAKDHGLPIIASHSNSYSVFPHSRNLTDREFLMIEELGGLVGISLAPQHLAGEKAEIEDVVRHILYYLSLDGENTVALGCDFDGISSVPQGLENLSDLPRLADALHSVGVSSDTVHRIFYQNAYDFAARHFL